MFNRILVAVDNSEDSRYVFETALFLALLNLSMIQPGRGTDLCFR